MGKLQNDPRLKFKSPPLCGFGHRIMDEMDGNLWAVDKIIDHASISSLQIMVEHDGTIGSRFVYSDDRVFLRCLGDKLIIECIGHSLTEIGDVELGSDGVALDKPSSWPNVGVPGKTGSLLAKRVSKKGHQHAM